MPEDDPHPVRTGAPRTGAATGDPSATQPDFASEPRLLDRDLAWLEFNRRVLHEAEDDRTPLLERLVFLGIFTSNLDEFFMKRVGRLYPSGMRVSDFDSSLAMGIREAVLPMLDAQARCLEEQIKPRLRDVGIHLLSWESANEAERDGVRDYFRDSVYPVLTPQAVDRGHPFPFVSNMSTSLAVALTYPKSEERIFARVKIPGSIPAWIKLASSTADNVRFMPLRDVIAHNLDVLFPGMRVREVTLFRITRNANVGFEQPVARDLLESVAEEVRRRRLQRGVRLEIPKGSDPWLVQQVVDAMGFRSEQVYELASELDYTDLKPIVQLKRPELKAKPWTPIVPPALDGDANLFAAIRAGDILVHHPYESFDASVARFLRIATEDDDVLAIKMTLYRAGDESPFIPLLIEAAEAGKQVACLIELKARFDEQRNIRWAQALEDSGVHVIYGVLGVKTHCKTVIVVRREPEGLWRYAHIGTGNYHPQTAKLYTDLSLLTCDEQITADVGDLFNYLTGRSLRSEYQHLLVAPVNMKEGFLQGIQREVDHHLAGRPARIIAKCNQIEDRDICEALYAASIAGVPIDMIIRGFCVLRPGVPGMSPTIRVISVIGRFLEHSRIYYFRNGAEDPAGGEMYIGSADWMRRNLEFRVEVAAPIRSRPLKQRCLDFLELMLADQRQAWDMQPDGSYVQRRPGADTPEAARIGSQQALMAAALVRQSAADDD